MRFSPVPTRLADRGVPQAVEVLGVRFQNLTRRQAARAVAELARADGKAYVVKPYSEFMPRAARDKRVRLILNDAALCLPDGAGILWAAHYLSLRGGRLRALLQVPFSLAALILNSKAVRAPLRQAMAGVDFTWEMLSALADAGCSVYLLGGTLREVTGATARIEERLPALRITGHRPGHFRLTGRENENVIAAVNGARPDVLLVAMGFPRQEKWIAENLPRLEVRVAVAEGGSFSFISGATRRAPRWMRGSGLEWLFRLLRQPSRLRRQLSLPVFVWLVLRQRLAREQ
jgi:N-acetylglucosaminyldiphosphoundecaprenol N-acetyl-beta-D-mannosaminyltransferase